MARIGRVVSILRALGVVNWREVRSLGSISGQNLLLFVVFVALQPESAVFFGLLFAAVLLFPLLTDPLQAVPPDRRATWPIQNWEWRVVRFGSLLLSPIVWGAIIVLLKGGWRMGAELLLCAGVLYLVKFSVQFGFGKASRRWSLRIPAPPGALGQLMRLQWREMLQTLDPYLAFSLMAATVFYRLFGKPLDPAAPRIISLVVVLAISTETQVLLGIDGSGAERYRQIPMRGWRILLAKDLAFLVMAGALVLPLDFISGIFGGLAALTIGHHRSVVKPIPQTRWRFTSGVLFMDGLLQTMALFAVGSTVRTAGIPFMSLCLAAWVLSLFFYGWHWDRVKG